MTTERKITIAGSNYAVRFDDVAVVPPDMKMLLAMFDEIETLRGAIREVVQEQHKATHGIVALHILDGKRDAVPCVDLMAVSLSVMMKAAHESKWMPPEYVMNDWVADVCRWLRDGPPGVEISDEDRNLLVEAWNFGQFADDFNQPLAKPLRALIRRIAAATGEQP